MPLKQDSRLIAIKTALGADALALRSFSIQERISRLFLIEAELSSEDGEVDFDKVVGHPATIRLFVGQKEKRYFDGIVSRLVQVANQGGYAHYRATIVPWLWFLTRTSDCRIFQKKSTPDIIEDVFKNLGFHDYKLKLSGNYDKREYCVQYRETNFNFVSRLMEQEGIYYFFEHQDGKHTLVLADSISAHKPFPGYADAAFHQVEQGTEREVVTDWTMEKEVQPVASVLQDFDFKKPKTSLLSSTKVSRKYGKAEYEIYDYPGEYVEHTDGQRLADVRLEELQTQYETLHGQATVRGLAAGHLFKLKNHTRHDQNRDYLITGVSLHADAGEFASGNSGGAVPHFFSCNFTAIDKTQQFRPARLTPKPIVQGPQTAIVVGPSGEEIYTDEHARVKVHFHWDRHDKSDENSSCWVRVSQFWAGKTWGSIHIPRIGQEVVIEFLEGDPDRPIITGRVYNADQTPPYDLPANKTQSGLKSRSSKGGSSPNFNEFRFEDKKGEEQVFLHAEKDQTIEVEHDEAHWVGHDRTKNIDNDETTHVKHDRTETVDNNETITIHGARTETVDKDETITIHQNRTETVDKDESITISGGRTENVSKDENITIGGARTESVAKDESITISGGRTESVSKDESITISGGRTENVSKDESVTVSGGRTVSIGKDDSLTVAKKLTIDAGDEITITTGSASISMKKDGTIAISGKDISIEGTGEINIKTSKNVTIKGQKILQN
jgi:type VI secretion system secreted protein VgrG